MADIARLIIENAARWRVARQTRAFPVTAKRLVAAKADYQRIEKRTGVPWFVIAVIDERETDENRKLSIAQGDPWDKPSRHVPKQRGPFQNWDEAAVDALTNCPPKAAEWKDWSAGGCLTLLEQYNGMGYSSGPVPTKGPNAGKKYPPQASPYIWSGTDQYKSGKYVADHDFRPEVVDVQPGCAALLMAMRAVDPTILFTDEIPAPPDVEPAKPPIIPHIPAGAVAAAGTAVAAQATGVLQIALILLATAAAVIGIYWFAHRSNP